MVVSYAVVLLIVCVFGVAYLADKKNIPSIPAYLLVGLLAGPIWFSISGRPLIGGAHNSTSVFSFLSELGLIFLLFIVGLQVDLSQIKGQIRGAGIMSLTQGLGIFFLSSIFLIVSGYSRSETLILGMALVPSSAAIVVPSLKRRDELSTESGLLDVSVLVLENVYLVIAIGAVSAVSQGSAAGIIGILGAILLGLVGAYAASKIAIPSMLDSLSKKPKSFLLMGLGVLGLFLIFSIESGLRPAIGAFFAGIALAQLPYSKRLQAALDPMTEIFLALFLVSLGLGLTPQQTFSVLPDALMLSALIVPAKTVFYFLPAYFTRLEEFAALKSSIDLSQVPDISIVFIAVAASVGVVGNTQVALITLTAIFTMTASSIAIEYGNRIASKFFTKPEPNSETPDAIVLGFERMSQSTIELITHHFDDVVIVSSSVPSSTIPEGCRNIVGDFTHEETRQKAGVKHAKTIISLKNDLDLKEDLAEKYPDKRLIIEEDSEEVTRRLLRRNVDYVLNQKVIAAKEMIERIQDE